jgi:hypothetical protein
MAVSTRGILAVMALLLIASIGLCILDAPGVHVNGHGHGHDHDSPRDLCLGMVALSLVVVLLVRPLPSGWAVLLRAVAVAAESVRILDPPPRLLSLA